MASQPVRVEDYDPFAPAVMANPLPFYKEMRRDQPVFYSARYDAFFVTRFNDCLDMLSRVDNSLIQAEGSLPQPAVLRKHNTGALPLTPTAPFPIAQRLGQPILGKVRNAHMGPLLPRQVAGLAATVREMANQRLDELLPLGRFNLTRDYGGLISSGIMMHLMGMPVELAGKSLDIINSGTRTDPEAGGFDSGAVAREAIGFYLPYVQARIDAGADGSVPMVDGMINWRFEGQQLEPAQIAQQLVCAFIGGIETVPKVTAHGLMELNARPEQEAAVRIDLDANVPRVTEEFLRYCAPAQWFARTVQRPVTIGGQDMKPGQRVFFMVASALRDEREFTDPDDFVWDRKIARVLTFGYGMHFCIGVHLARMEVRVLADTFLRRVKAYRFDMDKAVRHPSSFQWGWGQLPVIIDELA